MALATLSGTPYFSTLQHVGGPIVEDSTRALFHDFADQAFGRNYLTNSGPLAEQLEREIARIHNTREAVLAANGFLAQLILLHAMEVPKGEAIIPANTFVATPHACEMYGLKAVFADLDPSTLNMTPNLAERLITRETRLIIPTHIFGVLADMHGFKKLCDSHGIHLLADAAHAFDCDSGGVRPGNFDAPEFLSFHATKFFSSIEGGAILTNDSGLAKRARSIRNFGFLGPNNAELLGLNAKMSEISAAFALASLPVMEERRQRLLAVRRIYMRTLSGLPGVRIHALDAAGRNNYRYFAVFIDHDGDKGDGFPLTRDETERVLRDENILPRNYFFPGCHRMGYYQDRGCWDVPATDKVLGKILCLPTSFVDADWEESAEAVGGMFVEMIAKGEELRRALRTLS